MKMSVHSNTPDSGNWTVFQLRDRKLGRMVLVLREEQTCDLGICERIFIVRNRWLLKIGEVIVRKISLKGKLGLVVTITTY